MFTLHIHVEWHWKFLSPKYAMTPGVAATLLKLLPKMKCWIQSIGKGNRVRDISGFVVRFLHLWLQCIFLTADNLVATKQWFSFYFVLFNGFLIEKRVISF